MTLQEQAWQSGLVLLNETAEWDLEDWPPLEGGWRSFHASVVLHHPDTYNNDDSNNNNNRQTVVVLGGRRTDSGELDSVLLLNLVDPNKRWREGPPMKKRRSGHAAVVCNGGIYVMGGSAEYSSLDCMERIDSTYLLQSSVTTSITQESHWTTMTCRLSMKRNECCAVAVHDRYIVVMGGCAAGSWKSSSVDVIDTSNETVIKGPSMNVQRTLFGSAVIGHRIFVVGGCWERESVEYLDVAKLCNHEETKEDTTAPVPFFSSTWTTYYSHSVRSVPRITSYAVVAVGSCLVVAEGDRPTVEIFDTHHNCVWNLPSIGTMENGASMVTLGNQIAQIGGTENLRCPTLPLMDKNTWCFRQLLEQKPHGCFHSREGMGIRGANGISCTTPTSNRKRVRTNTEEDGT